MMVHTHIYLDKYFSLFSTFSLIVFYLISFYLCYFTFIYFKKIYFSLIK